ncbi:cyclase family protein [Saccharothrix syringae]|uniref:Cyclase family protein n=1 Tax=Saccharothrix syringae TaxID=103733 RepID=A0A5Q0GWV3_SACSY|nr:cyclase family protein [Saccharothrix syringae]QFZ17832.1 cyclase family protein [Saccharothrix syringae]
MCGPELMNLAKDSATASTASTVAVAPDPEPVEEVRPRADVNRRRALGMGAVLGATLAGIGALGRTPVAAAEALATRSASSFRVRDLSHAIHTDFPVYSPYVLEPNIFQSSFVPQDGYNALKLEIDEHTGTHMDAPWHFVDTAEALTSDRIRPENLVCPLVVIRIADRARTNLDAEVTIADLENWERRYGRIPDNALVAMDSGWTSRVLQGGEAMVNRDADNVPHFPGFSHAACEWLLSKRSVAGIAVDTPSMDNGPNSVSNPNAHRYFLGANKYGLEITANLNTAPDSGAIAVVGLLKTKGGTGGPVRLLAAF